jgi:hypothetical protein
MALRFGPDKSWTEFERVRANVRALARLGVLLAIVTLGAWAGRARAAEYCFFPDAPPTTFAASLCATEITWPTVWYAIDTGMIETKETGYVTGFNLIRDSTYPGMYVAKKTMPAGQGGQTFLFFRMRVDGATVSATDGTPYTSLKTAFWMITTTTDPAYPKPKFALAWDMQGVQNHGLEMTYQSAAYGTPALWSQTNFSDVDGNSGNRMANDIDGVGANWTAQKAGKEGYVRVVDGQSFTTGTSNFIDIAVSCAYFTRVAGKANIGTFNPCTQARRARPAVPRRRALPPSTVPPFPRCPRRSSP